MLISKYRLRKESTPRLVIAQKSAVLICFAPEAWNILICFITVH